MQDLSLHVLDIVQNSLKAKADQIGILIKADRDNKMLYVIISDNGHGMKDEMLKKVTDPFTTTRTTRPIGLGIPLLKEHCELTGGELRLSSKWGEGTILTASFGLDSIDRMPLGSIAQTMSTLVLSKPDVNYRLDFVAADKDFSLDWQDIREELGDVPLDEPTVLAWLEEIVNEKQDYIFGGVLDEITS